MMPYKHTQEAALLAHRLQRLDSGGLLALHLLCSCQRGHHPAMLHCDLRPKSEAKSNVHTLLHYYT